VRSRTLKNEIEILDRLTQLKRERKSIRNNLRDVPETEISSPLYRGFLTILSQIQILEWILEDENGEDEDLPGKVQDNEK